MVVVDSFGTAVVVIVASGDVVSTIVVAVVDKGSVVGRTE